MRLLHLRLLTALACMSGTACDLVLCNPEYTCEGSVVVRCDVKCTGGGGKLDPPKECLRVLTRKDCADESATLGVARTCKVIKNVGLCLDAPVAECAPEPVTSCTATGALTGCVTYYAPENKFVTTSACRDSKICQPLPGRALCVDDPKVACAFDGGYPVCRAVNRQTHCIGSEDGGFFESTSTTSSCRDAGP